MVELQRLGAKHYLVVVNSVVVGKLVGNWPSLMPLDTYLFADHEYGVKYHVALTADYENGDPRKFKLGTAAQVEDTMRRTWEIFPTDPRIVHDVGLYPTAIQEIIDHNGAAWPELRKQRSGRRKYLRLPYHPDCEEAERNRLKLYEDYAARNE